VDIRHAFVTPRNINDLLYEASVPHDLDILSIDIEGNDFWVWAAITNFRPRVVIIEYNAGLDPRSCLVQPYVEDWQWDGTSYYGASLGALRWLGRERGYRLVHTDLTGVNAFFVREDLISCFADIKHDAIPERSPNYYNVGYIHPPDPHGRTYLDLDRGNAKFVVLQLRPIVADNVESGSTIITVGLEGDQLSELLDRPTWPFPQADSTDEALVARLEAERAAGADYLLVAGDALPWLEARPAFRRHLDDAHVLAADGEEAAGGALYELFPPGAVMAGGARLGGSGWWGPRWWASRPRGHGRSEAASRYGSEP
jgi:hypothetical protein